MASLNATIARDRVLYPRPVEAMPDIMMIKVPARFRSARLGDYHPILIETAAEQDELEAYLHEEHDDTRSPDPFDGRASLFPSDHVTIAHYGPPTGAWPYVLLCRWPSYLIDAAPDGPRLFARGAYTFELFADRERLERASDRLLARLRRRRRSLVEVIPPDWSAAPGSMPH